MSGNGIDLSFFETVALVFGLVGFEDGDEVAAVADEHEAMID